MIKNILAAAAFGVAAMGAHASTNLQTDGDFETTGQSFASSSYCYPNYSGAQCGGAISGWSATGDVVFLTSGSAPWGDPAAQSHAGIDLGDVVAGVQRTAALTSDFQFTKNQEYLVSWVSTGRSNNGTAQSYTVSAGGVTDPVTITTQANGWETYSFEFVASDTSPLTFTGLSGEPGNVGDRTSFIDNVSITTVPEPTSLLMMAVATLGLLAWRRRAQV